MAAHDMPARIHRTPADHDKAHRLVLRIFRYLGKPIVYDMDTLAYSTVCDMIQAEYQREAEDFSLTAGESK